MTICVLPYLIIHNIDTNECNTNNAGCAQTCTNKPGTFECSCQSGYTLNGDGKSCDGKNMRFKLEFVDTVNTCQISLIRNK